MKELDDIQIPDYHVDETVDFLTEVAGYLQNTELHSTDTSIVFMKVGGMYFIEGSLDFGDDLTLDCLPEPANFNSFINTSTGEILTITSNSTIVTAVTNGTHKINGFYTAKEN